MEAYQKLFEVAQRFLKRKATISELRAAVRECEKEAAMAASVEIKIMRLWFQFLNRTSCTSKLRRLLSA
jgi:hypothetical protein